MKHFGVVVGALLVAFAGTAQAAPEDDRWAFSATLYGYFPSISGTTVFPPPDGPSSSVGMDIDTILDNLKFAFMGSFEANYGRWGGFADVIYMDIGNTHDSVHDFRLGNRQIPGDVSARVSYDLKGWVTTAAGTYRLNADRNSPTSLVFGARMLNMRPKINWTLGGNVGPIQLADRSGTREIDERNIDAIIGLKGRMAFDAGSPWYVPYYVDIGAGDSKFTWQAMAGVGYAFGWGDIIGAWRYIDYDMKSGDAIQDLSFSGPAVAVVFRW